MEKQEKNSMEPSELQIGNWVMYNPNVFIEDEYEPTHENYPTQIKTGEDIDLAIENCYSPIPLTPEILEKNGFVNVYRGRYRFDDNKGSNVEVSTINGVIKWVKVFKYDSDDIEDTLARFTSYEIKHLHELQNAMALCKIDKEIEL